MVDSEVSRLKFDRELQTLGEQRRTLESRGIFVLDSTAYPFLELAFVPRHLLQVGIPAVQTGAIILPQGAIMAVEIPSLAARAFKARLVLLDDHPITHKPFLCIRGIREYHEHPQHSGDDWLLYRQQMSLFSILMSLWRVTVDLVHPQMFYQPTGLQVNWAAEEKV